MLNQVLYAVLAGGFTVLVALGHMLLAAALSGIRDGSWFRPRVHASWNIPEARERDLKGTLRAR